MHIFYGIFLTLIFLYLGLGTIIVIEKWAEISKAQEHGTIAVSKFWCVILWPILGYALAD